MGIMCMEKPGYKAISLAPLQRNCQGMRLPKEQYRLNEDLLHFAWPYISKAARSFSRNHAHVSVLYSTSVVV